VIDGLIVLEVGRVNDAWAMLEPFPESGFLLSACRTRHWVSAMVSLGAGGLISSGTDSWQADYVSAFPGGVNVAATWDRSLAFARGQAMGEEHRGKGVDVQLGPVCGPLGRSPEGGRNWVWMSLIRSHIPCADAITGRLQPRSILDWRLDRAHGPGDPKCRRHCMYEALHWQRAGAFPPGRRVSGLWIRHHRVHQFQHRGQDAARTLSMAICRRCPSGHRCQ